MTAPTTDSALFDVVAQNIATGAKRFLAEAKTERNAEAIIEMAVIRRGIETEFYYAVPHPESLPGAEPPPKWRPGLMVQRCPIGGYMACDADRCDGTYGYGSTEEEAIADLDAMDSYDDSTFHQHSGRFADND